MKFKNSYLTIVLISIITVSYGCLEPSGDEGSAIGRTPAAANAETEENSADDTVEDAAPAIAFTDIETAVTNSCATAGCHSTAGGIVPILETAEQWRALTADTLDGDDVTNGDAVLESIDPNGTGNPMPPAGGGTLGEPDRQRMIDWIEAGMP